MASEDTPLFSKPFFFINISVAYVTGLLMNALLLYLIRKKTPNEMKSYSRIMRIHCISDIIYDFIQVLAGKNRKTLK
jgi:Na+-transporting NADH:ubiquinone oxidoreductase subunit NqrD